MARRNQCLVVRQSVKILSFHFINFIVGSTRLCPLTAVMKLVSTPFVHMILVPWLAITASVLSSGVDIFCLIYTALKVIGNT